MSTIYYKKDSNEDVQEIDLTHVCLNCGITFHKGKKMKISIPKLNWDLDIYFNSFTRCPCCDRETGYMDSEVFMCDNEIVETILLLDKKGYKTKSCCAGHSHQINKPQGEYSYTIENPYIWIYNGSSMTDRFEEAISKSKYHYMYFMDEDDCLRLTETASEQFEEKLKKLFNGKFLRFESTDTFLCYFKTKEDADKFIHSWNQELFCIINTLLSF